MTGLPDETTGQTLFDQGILPARPVALQKRIVHAQPLDFGGASAESTSSSGLLGVLSQYGIEAVPIWSYYQCQPAPNATILWPIEQDAALLYQQSVESGRVFLINTAADDSTSSLTKSASVLPLYRYLLGVEQRFAGMAFHADDTIVLDGQAFETDSEAIDLLDAEGRKHRIDRTDRCYMYPGPHAVGWCRILSRPPLRLGIQPARGETDWRVLACEQVRAVVDQTFRTVARSSQEPPGTRARIRESVALEKPLIWILLLMIVLEAGLANRMER